MYVQLPSHSSCYLQLTSLTYKVYIKFSWCIWEQLNLIICFVIRKLLCSTQTGTIVNSVCKIKSIVVHRTDLHTEYKNVILCRRIRRTLHGVVHILCIGTFLHLFVLWCNQIWVIILIFVFSNILVKWRELNAIFSLVEKWRNGNFFSVDMTNTSISEVL